MRLSANGLRPTAKGAEETPSCQWLSGNHVNGPSDVVWEVTTFDDGSGLALYAGGRFETIGGELIETVARWDGTSWQQVGSNLRGEVSALVAFDDGSGPALYAAGTLRGEDGDQDIRGIARWDGTSWRVLGEGVGNTVIRLLAHDDGTGAALYAAGWLTTAGGQPVNNIAKWDGSQWSALGEGTGPVINGLVSFDDGNGNDLYAAGWFTSAGGDDAARYLARWDGTSWSAVSSEIIGDSDAMTVYDDGNGPALYVAATFELGGDLIIDGLAKWDGTTWTLIAEFDRPVARLKVLNDGSGDKLYIGGFFEQADGQELSRLAVWDGSTLEPIGPGFNDGVVAFTSYDDGTGSKVVAAGHFERSADNVANRIAHWNGSSWRPFGISGTANGLGSAPYASVTFDDGRGPALYVGGVFESAGPVAAHHIARWDGSAWEPLGSGTDDLVEALAVFDDGTGPALYAAGDFDNAGGVPTAHIAKWDGASWSAVAWALRKPDGRESRIWKSSAVARGAPFTSPAIFPRWGVCPWNGSPAGTGPLGRRRRPVSRVRSTASPFSTTARIPRFMRPAISTTLSHSPIGGSSNKSVKPDNPWRIAKPAPPSSPSGFISAATARA